MMAALVFIYIERGGGGLISIELRNLEKRYTKCMAELQAVGLSELDTYKWKSIILKLVLSKRGERDWNIFTCQERATKRAVLKKIRGISWLLERLICYQK